MKKVIILTIVACAVIALAYTQRATFAEQILARALPARLSADTAADQVDGLHVVLCGAGGPMPAPNASGPCVLVTAGKQTFVVDAGTDGARNINRMGFQVGNIDAVFLTHFHSDHIDGLGELATLRWAAGNSDTPLPVYGPVGVERVVNGFNEAMGKILSIGTHTTAIRSRHLGPRASAQCPLSHRPWAHSPLFTHRAT